MIAAIRINQLRGDTQARTDLSYAAFNNISCAKALTCRPHIDRLTLEGEARVSSDDEQYSEAAQLSDNVFRNAINKIFLLRVTTHVDEWQDSNRRPVIVTEWGVGHVGSTEQWPDEIGPNGAGNVLEGHLAHVLHNQTRLNDSVELAGSFLEYLAGNADPSGFGEGFQPRGDIDAIAVNVGAFTDNVAEIYSDPKHNVTIIGNGFVGVRHLLLKLDRRVDRVHRTSKFNQYTIAHHFHDPPTVRTDRWFKDGFSSFLQRGKSARLVSFHESAVAYHIGREDGGETALSAFFGHSRDRLREQLRILY